MDRSNPKSSETPNLRTMDTLDDVERIEENVFAIIESKIQYNEYRINNAANSFINLEDSSLVSQKTPAEMKRIVFSNEHIIDLIRKYTGAINLLLVLRSKLNKANAYSVFSILKDDQYLSFSKLDIVALIEGRPHQVSA